MNEVIGRRRPIASFIIKLMVVLVFPLTGFVAPSFLGWDSILLLVNGFSIPFLNSILSLIAGLLILLPCMTFERQLNSRPITASVRGRAAVACILSWGISLLLQLTLFLPFWRVDNIYRVIMCTPILAISFFVILPLISRETTKRSLSAESHNLSYHFVTSTLRKRFRREKILSGLLWVGLMFCPFMVFLTFAWWTPQLEMISLFYQTSIFGGGPFLIREALLPHFEYRFAMMPSILLPLFALLSALRFVFVRDVFRFQGGHIKKSRLVSVAILGEILPSAVIILLALITSSSSYIPLFLPFPILPIIGFVFIRFSKIIPIKQELWPDYEHRMWYEKEREPYTPAPLEETIKVPVGYLLVSQIRRRRK